MAEKLEVERKYEVPVDFALPSLIGIAGVASVAEPEVHRLDAVYYDTAGLRLVRGRVTLRRRSGGNDAGWHLKRPSGGERSELQLPATKRQRTPPHEITAQVRAMTRGEPLQPVARIRTERIERAVRAADGSTIALLADDTVRTESADGSKQWRELEAELVDGSPDDLARLDAALRAAGAKPSKAPSKLSRALGPAADPPAPPAGQGALADYLRAQVDAIVEHDPGVRAGDAEAVHKMRVATRRTRSTLRSFGDLLDASAGELDRLHEEVKWLTGLLGEVRDGDVMAERLAGLIAAEPPELVLGPVRERVVEQLGARTDAARVRLVAELDGERYITLLNELDALVAAAGAAGDIRGRVLRRHARKAVRRADKRLDAADKEPAEDEATEHTSRDARLHEARKAYKRARYAAELLAPVAGTPAQRLADRLTDLQDVLGAHQDAIVTGDLLRDYGQRAHEAGENAFTYGLLKGRQDAQADAALADLPKVRRKASKRKVRFWL